MVHLVAFLQSTQYADGVVHVGLVDEHALETAFQGLVFLEILLVFGQGGGTDCPQLATSQCRLEDVGGIHGSFAAAGTHQGVNLIDKEDNLAVGLVNLTDDAFQPFLKLALVLGTSNQCAHVQAVDGLAFQVLRHVAAHNTVCQTLGDSRLTYTGLADKDGVVLSPAAENLQHTPDFLVTTDNGVKLAGLSQLIEVLGVLVQGVVSVLGALAAHLAAFAQVGNGGLEALFAHAGILHQVCHLVPAGHQPKQHVLDRDKVVAHLSGQLCGLHQCLIGVIAQILAAAAHARQLVQQRIRLLSQPGDVHLQFLQKERCDILIHTQDSF